MANSHTAEILEFRRPERRSTAESRAKSAMSAERAELQDLAAYFARRLERMRPGPDALAVERALARASELGISVTGAS